MVGPLNHVGVAVPSIEKAAQTYRDLYDIADITEPSEMPTQGVRFCFVNLENSQIELIEPLGCLLYTSPSPRDATLSRMPSSA